MYKIWLTYLTNNSKNMTLEQHPKNTSPMGIATFILLCLLDYYDENYPEKNKLRVYIKARLSDDLDFFYISINLHVNQVFFACH